MLGINGTVVLIKRKKEDEARKESGLSTACPRKKMGYQHMIVDTNY